MRWADGQPATHPSPQSAVKAAAEIKEKTGGRIDVQSFPNGQLGSSRDMVESVASGALTMVTEGAAQLGQRESAVTAMVGRLEKAGFVERRPSESDGRAWELWPTDAGADALRRLDAALATVNGYIDEAIGVDVDGVVDALQRLSELLD